jgi:DNA-binding SARP family transcriptional activator
MGFRILGPLAVIYKGKDITPTAPKVRQVLTFLIVRRNQIVQVSEFVDELWGSHPPESAMTTLQTYVYKLRKDVLDPSGLARLQTQPSGYFLDVLDENVDVCDFERLSAEGRLALENDDPRRAAELLSRALGLWRGQALASVTVGEILSAHVTRLEENRLRALEMRIEADMCLGRYQELVSELKVLVYTHPLHERFHGDLMIALNRSGRRYEALEVYRRLRGLLIDELGIEPSAPVQRLHQSLLSAGSPRQPGRVATVQATPNTDRSKRAAGANGGGSAGPSRAPATAPTSNGSVPAIRDAAALTVPAQLPPDISDFTGRVEPLKEGRRRLTARDDGTTARTLCICGMVGAGKTTLALHLAHVERAHYPDGQLYSDLQGASARPVPPAEVLASFLGSVGVPEHQIPATLEERAKLFRTWSTGRRVLVVLDDAAAASHVASLLPATPQCAVIITSRRGLQSLPGVHIVELTVMAPAESVELLTRIIGRERVGAELEQAAKIADLCGHLPLALRCIGARLAAAPTWSLHKMATLIESSASPFDQLKYEQFDLRACFDDSYSHLAAHDRSAFRLLSLLPPQHFTVVVAAGLLGKPADIVEAQLTRLAMCHLIEATTEESTKETNYKLHPLIHHYARERLHREYLSDDGSDSGRLTV